MNWKAVVGVSMLCITMMTGCEEKKTHSSRSNETVKEKVEVSKKDKEKEETVTEQGTPEDSSEEDTEEQKYKFQKIDISAKEQRRIEKRLTDVIEKCRGIYHGQTECVDTGQDGAENLASSFRKMLTLEQFRNEEMQKLYQRYLVSGHCGRNWEVPVNW